MSHCNNVFQLSYKSRYHRCIKSDPNIILYNNLIFQTCCYTQLVREYHWHLRGYYSYIDTEYYSQIGMEHYSQMGIGYYLLNGKKPLCRGLCPLLTDVSAGLELSGDGGVSEVIDCSSDISIESGVCIGVHLHPSSPLWAETGRPHSRHMESWELSSESRLALCNSIRGLMILLLLSLPDIIFSFSCR